MYIVVFTESWRLETVSSHMVVTFSHALNGSVVMSLHDAIYVPCFNLVNTTHHKSISLYTMKVLLISTDFLCAVTDVKLTNFPFFKK